MKPVLIYNVAWLCPLHYISNRFEEYKMMMMMMMIVICNILHSDVKVVNQIWGMTQSAFIYSLVGAVNKLHICSRDLRLTFMSSSLFLFFFFFDNCIICGKEEVKLSQCLNTNVMKTYWAHPGWSLPRDKTDHLHLVSGLRVYGALPPLLHTILCMRN